MEGFEDAVAVDQLIIEKLKTVPHFEGLLLLWTTRPKAWTAQELASRLYINGETAGRISFDLGIRESRCRRGRSTQTISLEWGVRRTLFEARKPLSVGPDQDL